MSASRKDKKSELGNCPNCNLPLREGHYGTIPLKDDDSVLKFQEGLVICSPCLEKPERLSPENIRKSLEEDEIKWDEGDITIAMSAVEAYKKSKINS